METKAVITEPPPDSQTMVETEQIWKFVGGYYSLFNKRKLLILLFCLLGAVLGLTYALVKKKIYTAEIKFVSNVDNSDANGYLNLAQQFGLINSSGGNGAFSGDNLMELMKTPSLINKALFTTVTIHANPVLLFDYYLESKKIRESWRKDHPVLASMRFGRDLSKPEYLRDSILKLIDKDISAELSVDKNDKELDFISVKMTDIDSAVAKTFTETLVKTVTDYYIEITTAKYLENVNVLQAKADSLNRNFGQRLTNIASSEDININPSRRITNVPVQKQQIGVQVDNAVYQEVIKNLELAKIQLQKQTPFIQLIETPKYPLEEIKVSKPVSTVIGFIAGGVLAVFFLVGWNEAARFLKKLKRYSQAANEAS